MAERAELGNRARARAAAARMPLALTYARRLLALHDGDIRAAGAEYDERHGFSPGAGEKLLSRLGLGGAPAQIRGVSSLTLDRLWVLS